MIAGLVFLTTLCPLAAAIEDEVHLMQLKQTVLPGSGREQVDFESADDVAAEFVEENKYTDETKVFERFMMQDDDAPTAPAGCSDKGCSGSGPYCGGSDNDCTTRGFVVTGYYKTCGWDTCQTGWKVRCAMCPADATPSPAVVYPTPAPAVAVWAEPAFVAAPTPAPVPAFAAPVMPTDAPVYAPVAFDQFATTNATAALAAAQAALAALKYNLSLAESDMKACNKNVSFFLRKGIDHKKAFIRSRDAAVRYSKMRELSNVTIFKSQQDMSNAFFAQAGAEDAAQVHLATAANHNSMRMYYEKVYIDAKHNVSLASSLADVAHTAVRKANSVLDAVKHADFVYKDNLRKDGTFKANAAEAGTKTAMRLAVKHSMENAWTNSSVGRVANNTPAWGNGNPLFELTEVP